MLSMKKSRGFKSLNEKSMVVNISDLARTFPDGAKINPAVLIKNGLVPCEGKIKVLGDGAIGIKVIIEGCAVSATAKEKIEKAGGSVL